jgi:hypothetical protein
VGANHPNTITLHLGKEVSPVKVLSIDWDYFFQDTDGFDWGHREAPFFIEDIWWHRCSNRHLFTMRDAIDMRPVRSRLYRFWEKNIRKFSSPSALMISESHGSLYYWIHHYPVEELVNYDAHHDLGYPDAGGDVDCGNWAGKLLDEGFLKHYTQVYPSWRKQKRYREQMRDDDRVYVTYSPIPAQNYDLVFICRSGAWTPTWCDPQFVQFCDYWRTHAPWIWDKKNVVFEPLKERNPNMEEARETFIKMRQKYEELGVA